MSGFITDLLKTFYPQGGAPQIKMAKSNMRLITFSLFYLVFVVLGAAIFSAIEAPNEVARIKDLRLKRANFLRDHPCISDSELEDFITEILEASSRGVSAIMNVTSEPNWSFGQSFFFSSTIVTTIGYGHVHPLSEGGKIFCIIYAFIGIPMTFILLAALVERILVPTTWLLHYMNSQLGHLYQPFNIRVFHLAAVAGSGIIFFVVLPALMFAKIEEGWNYLDAFYYCFISITTIGLGDYIPGDSRDQSFRPLYKICIAAYLLIGLTFVMLLLNLYNDIPQLNIGFLLLRRSDMPTDPERMHLSSGVSMRPQKYSQQNEQPILQNVKVVSRPVDSPTPEEDTTPVHAQMAPITPNLQ